MSNLLALQDLAAVFAFAVKYSHRSHSEFVLQYHKGLFPNSEHKATFAFVLPRCSSQLVEDAVIPPWKDHAGATVALLKCLQQLRS